jgi:hypothetical protein
MARVLAPGCYSRMDECFVSMTTPTLSQISHTRPYKIGPRDGMDHGQNSYPVISTTQAHHSVSILLAGVISRWSTPLSWRWQHHFRKCIKQLLSLVHISLFDHACRGPWRQVQKFKADLVGSEEMTEPSETQDFRGFYETSRVSVQRV